MKSKKTPHPVASASDPNAARQSTAESLLGHRFRDGSLLLRALTHRSLAYETDRENLADAGADNEQLEFVGDAVLGMVVAESLYRRFPRSPEGELTRLRASLVSRKHLGDVAARLGVGAMLRLGKGEERSGGRGKSALLANALEAVIAAIYLDGKPDGLDDTHAVDKKPHGLEETLPGGGESGLAAAAAFIDRTIILPALPSLDLALAPVEKLAVSGSFSGAVGDHKSALQEYLQAAGAGQPEYALKAESGPDHRKRFHVEVRITSATGLPIILAESEGSTKKSAQQEAARIAFARLLRESDLELKIVPESIADDRRQDSAANL